METATATVDALPISEPLVLDIPQLARLLNVSPRTARARVKDGSVPSVRIGGLIRIPYEKLRKVLNGEVATAVA